MQSTIGNSIKLSLFGESHGTAIGIVIDGLAPGIKLDTDFIQEQLEKRKKKGKVGKERHEADCDIALQRIYCPCEKTVEY